VAAFRPIQPATPVVSACTCDSATETVTTHGATIPATDRGGAPQRITEEHGGSPRLQPWKESDTMRVFLYSIIESDHNMKLP